MQIQHDFYSLWAGARLIVRGENPYDPLAVVNELSAAGLSLQEMPGGFHNPPFSLWLFAPFGMLPLAVAQSLWFLLSLLALAMSLCFLLKLQAKLFPTLPRLGLVQIVVVLISFVPLVKMLLIGQSSYVVLLGLCSSLFVAGRGKYTLAGALFSLTLIKPQLVFALVFALSVYVWKAKAYRILIGAGLGVLLQLGASLLLVPEAIEHFLNFVSSFSDSRREVLMVTIGHAIASLSGFRFAPECCLVLGALIAVGIAMKVRFSSHLLYFILIPLSLLTTTYAWSHDHILLLPAYLALASVAIAFGKNVFYALTFISALLSGLVLSFGGPRYEIFMLWLPVFIVSILVFPKASHLHGELIPLAKKS